MRVPWTARKSNQSILKEISPEFIGRTDAEAETPVLWPPDANSQLIGKDWCWEKWKAGEEGDDRVWNGWMASLTPWTCVWASSRNWWWTGKPGMLQYMGLQRVRHDWATELNWKTPSAATKTQWSQIFFKNVLLTHLLVAHKIHWLI